MKSSAAAGSVSLLENDRSGLLKEREEREQFGRRFQQA
jgi:hypothetical protein